MSQFPNYFLIPVFFCNCSFTPKHFKYLYLFCEYFGVKIENSVFSFPFFFSVSSRKTSWYVALSIIPFIYSVSYFCILIICILSSFYKITFLLNQIIWLIILCSTRDEIQDTIHFRLAFNY